MRRPTRSASRPARTSARPSRTGGQLRRFRGRTAQLTRPVRRAAATAAPRSAGGLTGRAAVLGLVLCALVVSAALPLREYLAQRSQIADVQHDQAAAAARVAALDKQLADLKDPDQIAALARERLHFTQPGETTYVVLTPAPTPTPSRASGTVDADASAPWYSQLWGSVQSADSPPAPTPTPSTPVPTGATVAIR